MSNLTFAAGTDPDIASSGANKLQLAGPSLPQRCSRRASASPNPPTRSSCSRDSCRSDHGMSKFDIANYVVSNIQDPVSRVNGVGKHDRVRLSVRHAHLARPEQAEQLRSDAARLTAACRRRTCRSPAASSVARQPCGTSSSPRRSPSDAAAHAGGVQQYPAEGPARRSQVRLSDVARVAPRRGELQTSIPNTTGSPPRHRIQLAPGANALQTANAVRARIAQLQPYFPHGLQVVYPNDTTPFIRSPSRKWSRPCWKASRWSFW